MKRAILVACTALLFALPASAKDLSGKWGVGFTKAFAPEGSGLSAIGVRYWVDRQLGVEGLFGYKSVNRDDDDDRRDFNLGARFLIKMVEEDNLHAYGGAGLALLYSKVEDESDTGVGVDAFVGVEYFFQGLPNLGFSSEVGLGLSDVGSTTTFGTQGESFVNLARHYYF